MWLSPLHAVLMARSKGSLGSLNPLPFNMMMVNSIAWVMYAVLLNDYYVFFGKRTIILPLFARRLA
jgi:hypothetical protein